MDQEKFRSIHAPDGDSEAASALDQSIRQVNSIEDRNPLPQLETTCDVLLREAVILKSESLVADMEERYIREPGRQALMGSFRELSPGNLKAVLKGAHASSLKTLENTSGFPGPPIGRLFSWSMSLPQPQLQHDTLNQAAESDGPVSEEPRDKLLGLIWYASSKRSLQHIS
jgi:hypothetical protein